MIYSITVYHIIRDFVTVSLLSQYDVVRATLTVVSAVVYYICCLLAESKLEIRAFKKVNSRRENWVLIFIGCELHNVDRLNFKFVPNRNHTMNFIEIKTGID